MKTPKMYNIILFVKFRGCDEWLTSSKIEQTENELNNLTNVLENMKSMDKLYFELTDGSKVYLHPDDISYINIKIITSIKQRLINFFTLTK